MGFSSSFDRKHGAGTPAMSTPVGVEISLGAIGSLHVLWLGGRLEAAPLLRPTRDAWTALLTSPLILGACTLPEPLTTRAGRARPIRPAQ